MRQRVVTQPKVEGQPRSDMPIVIAIKIVVIVDPMLVRQKLQLGKARSVSQQEIDIGISGIRSRVEHVSSLRVCLQLLVLDHTQIAGAKLELVPSPGERYIVANLVGRIEVLPGEVTRRPVCTIGRTQIDFWQPATHVVSERKERAS